MARLNYCIDIVKGDECCNILSSEGVEFLLSSSEGKVPLPSSDGKTICLYFSANWCRPCNVFTPQLIQAYNTINNKGSGKKNLEIILVSSDHGENEFREHLKTVPWLAVPFDSGLSRRLSRRFNVNHIPSLIPLSSSSDGYTLVPEENAVDLVKDYGVDAFPFTRMRRNELEAMDNAKRRGVKVEDLLAHVGRLVSGDEREVSLSRVAGKTVGLYFGAYWCPPSCSFTKQLTEAYDLIVAAQNQSFEVIFVSTDRDEDEFEMCLSKMPWPAIPYKDKIRTDLRRIFEIKKIPALVLLAPNGKIITANGRSMVSSYGALAFPFTETRIKVIESALEKEGQRLPRKVQDPKKHEHELKLDMARAYVCDACGERGRFWAFSCDECNFDLHPACVEKCF